MKILAYFKFDDEIARQVSEAAPGHELLVTQNEDEAARLIVDAEVLFGFCSPKIFANARKLKWFQSQSAGLDAVLFPALVESNVILTNAAGVYATHAADHAFALLLGLARGVHRFAEDRLQRRWNRYRLVELSGQTLGIIGMGGFGLEMAKRARGFDLRVISVDAYRTEAPQTVDELWGMDRLDDLLATSDVVMVACPLTSETRHLLNAERLAMMKAGSFLINVARGGIIDECALVEALRSGRLAGAGLDVFEVEPLPQESPLWSMENVILTSHAAGTSQYRLRRIIGLFGDNLRAYQRGEPLRNVVSKQKGF